MKFAILLSILLATVTAQANEAVLSCKLKSLPEMEDEGVVVSGDLTIEKDESGELLMHATMLVTEDGEEPNLVELGDIGTTQVWNESTKPTAEEFVSNSSDLNGIRDILLPKQVISEYMVYSGKNYQDDGNGINLLKYTATTGKSAMLASVGWLFLLCE